MSGREGPKFTVVDWTGVEDPYNPGMDFPTAWAIQKEVGEQLQHDPRCSSVPGWHPFSGPGLLCDCGAIRDEWERRRALTPDSDPHTQAGPREETSKRALPATEGRRVIHGSTWFHSPRQRVASESEVD